jgi:hypothetical protein
MDKHELYTAAKGTNPKQQLHEKPIAPHDTPSSSKLLTIPLAADPARDPEDPLRNDNHANSENYDSHSDSDTHVGDISDIQNASKRPAAAETPIQKKITTTQAVIIFFTNEVGIGT